MKRLWPAICLTLVGWLVAAPAMAAATTRPAGKPTTRPVAKRKIAAPTTRPTTRPAAFPSARSELTVEVPEALKRILSADAVPKGAADLKAMEEHMARVAAAVVRSTVSLRVGGRGGSGVIVSPEGHVMTCAHVTREADLPVRLVLHDGRGVRGKTLGAEGRVDAGLIKITDKPPAGGWPFSEPGRSADLKPGQWCMAAGHPGGMIRGRTAPVRLGRVLGVTPTMIVTDCTIVSGDSGGPLFDMNGRVIGISSRIMGSLTGNVHVPVDAFRKDWPRFVKGDVWGPVRGQSRPRRPAPKPTPPPKPKPPPPPKPKPAPMGIRLAEGGVEVKVAAVEAGSRAAEAGLRVGDVIMAINGRMPSAKDVPAQLATLAKSARRVRLVVRRNGRRRRIRIRIPPAGESGK